MSALAERLVVGLAVLASLVYAFKSLAPYAWRVALAQRLQGRVPDRARIWLAGRTACEACATRPAKRG